MRTLAPVALGFQLGLFAAQWVVLGPAAVWLALACLAAGAGLVATGLAARASPPRRTAVLAVASAFGAGLALGPPLHQPAQLPPGGMVRVTGRVEETQYGLHGQARSRLRVEQGTRIADGVEVPAGTGLWVQPWPLPEGARVRTLVSIAPRVPFRNPSPHPELATANATRGQATLAAPTAFETLSQPALARWLDVARTHLRGRLDATLPPTAAGVARALILGDPASLSDDDEASVRASGLAHVFAVSGMHVTLLAGSCLAFLTWLLGWLRPLAARTDVRRIAALACIPLTLLLAAFTGGSPSGWRAAITTAIAWAMIALGRRPDAVGVSAASCLVFGAVCPSDALRPAFLLSIAATAAILTARWRPEGTTHALLRGALALSVRTSLATSPIVLWTFGSLPLLGVLANVVLVPLGSALLVLSALHSLLVCVATPAALLTTWLLTTGSRAFLAGCDAFASTGPSVAWPVLDAWQGAAACVCAALALLAREVRVALVVLAIGAALLLGLELHLRAVEQPHDELRVTFLDVGQGDAALIDLPDGHSLLVDAGGNPEGGADPGARVLLPLLRARRRDHLDLAVLSHPHPDHYGGFASLLAALPVRELWDSGQAEGEASLDGTSHVAAQLLATARVHGTRVKAPGELCGHARAFGAARIDVLWPCPSYDAGYDPNDNSLVLRVRYGAHTFLFTGDIEAHAEQALLASGVDLHADVLKVAHHGSHTSSSAAFLRAVSPRLAVISAGAVNRFGHPHADVVQRLQAVAQTVVDLGKTGGVIVRSDGHDLSLAGNDLERTVRSCALPQMTPLTSERRPASPSSDRGSP